MKQMRKKLPSGNVERYANSTLRNNNDVTASNAETELNSATVTGDEDVEDVDLDEFIDEIEGWVLDELKAIGCDTAKSVLDISAKDLVLRTDLEKETVEDVLKILNSEFEK